MSFYDDASLVFLPSGGAGKDGKAYSIKPTNGDGDFTFSRGSNLTATRVDSNGLIEKGRENLLLQSNQFDTTWSLSNTSVTSGQSGYDGTNDAWLLNSTTTGSPRIQQTISQGGVSTFSVYAKAATDDYIQLKTSGISSDAWFNLSTGAVTNTSGSAYVDSNITSVGNGWYRCSVTFNGTISSLRIYPASAFGTYSTSGNGVYIQDAQLEQGLVATEYIESGASTGLAGILEDSPRFDYSGGASCPSLLLEPQRSNIVVFTEYIEGTNWGVGGSTGLQLRTSIASPDGNNGVYLVTSEAENTSSRVQYNLGTLGNDHIFSVFIKGTGSATRIRLRNNTASVNAVEYDIDSSGNFTLHSENALDGYYGADDYGNGWYRVYLKVDTNGGGNNFMQIYSDVVDADGSIYVWGVQAEEGSYPTSYIPNHSGGSVTREFDETQELILDDDLTSVVLFGEITALDVVRDSSQRLLQMGKSGTDHNAFYAYRNNSTNERRATFYTRNDSGTQAFIAEAPTERVKFAMQYNAGNGSIKVYVNGSNALSSSITDADYTEFEKFKLSGEGGAVRVHQFIALKSTYTNDELATLTTL